MNRGTKELYRAPAGPQGQKLLARWERLMEEFTGGDADVLERLKAMVADRANWPAEAKAASRVTPGTEVFIQKAMEAARLKPVR